MAPKKRFTNFEKAHMDIIKRSEKHNTIYSETINYFHKSDTKIFLSVFVLWNMKFINLFITLWNCRAFFSMTGSEQLIMSFTYNRHK